MRTLTAASFALFAFGCGTSTTAPDAPAVSSIVFTATSPPSGSTVVVPDELRYNVPGGVVLPPGSGLVSVGLSLRSAHAVPWAQLNVYLLTGPTSSDYCGQNLPDSPTWSFLSPGWTTAFTVTGFQVYRLPCDVTGFRAMLHMRNNGLLLPPTASETIAEAALPTRFQIRRADTTDRR
jgi:hypothetical protein